MELTLRLNILRDSGQLSQQNYDKVLKVIDHFKEKMDIT
ncbi:transcriptional antiterminator, partial [Clostridium perfringens]|nr:transcriptional antiterminator [Clostridium perfringens]